MPTRIADPRRPLAIPIELCGQWVAWNAAHTRIVAHAETLKELRQAVREKQIDDPVFEKVPRADVRFVGARRSLCIASTSVFSRAQTTTDGF